MHLRNAFLIACCFALGCGATAEAPGGASDETAATTPAGRRTIALAEDDPILELSELGLFFGQVCGGDFADKILVLRNAGGGPLTVGNLVPTGQGFTVVNKPALPFVLPPGGQRQVRLRFAPGGSRLPAFDGNLRIISNDPAWPLADVVLSGLSLPGSLRVLPRQHDFGNVPSGDERSFNYTLRADGECPVFLSGTRLTGNLSYAVTVGDIPDQLLPGQVASVNVRLFCGGQDDIVEVMMRFLDRANRPVGNAQIQGYCNAPNN